MPELSDTMKGVDIGKNHRQKYVWVECPICHNRRWRTQSEMRKHKSPTSHLNLCHHCSVSQRGKQSSGWKGGRTTDGGGYIYIWVFPYDFFYPMAKKAGYVAEHRLVMAKHLGRNLHRWEIVHHRNHIRDDNRIENLQLVSRDRHTQITILERRITTLEGLLRDLRASLAFSLSEVPQTEYPF